MMALQTVIKQRQEDAEKRGPCIVPGPFQQEKGCLRAVLKRQWCHRYDEGEPRWQVQFFKSLLFS